MKDLQTFAILEDLHSLYWQLQTALDEFLSTFVPTFFQVLINIYSCDIAEVENLWIRVNWMLCTVVKSYGGFILTPPEVFSQHHIVRYSLQMTLKRSCSRANERFLEHRGTSWGNNFDCLLIKESCCRNEFCFSELCCCALCMM